eukprot:TRINITY_DN57891_c0_g1_i1.p1 TRINITY_DN57891_c0_g1~~TRINITY_DN57891_c0_g1_i1.p1  ORF type:complete len:259 (+),score=51.27 TRINITY_DN57891_c0_g1_i1:78-779(+)
MVDIGFQQHSSVGWHGPGRYRYLPPPPESSPGRVIIRADADASNFPNIDLSKFKPTLNGNRGYVLQMNKDWLKASELDRLLEELTALGQGGWQGEDSEVAVFKPMQTMGSSFLKIAAAMLAVFFVIAGVMFYGFHNRRVEVFPIFIFGFAAFGCLAFFNFRQMGSTFGSVMGKLDKLSKQRIGFAMSFSKRFGLELRYVDRGANVPYFELSQDYGGGESESGSEDNFFNSNIV